eukprot:scaffold15271_cov110-Isochrysis_galbana.AAC.6
MSHGNGACGSSRGQRALHCQQNWAPHWQAASTTSGAAGEAACRRSSASVQWMARPHPVGHACQHEASVRKVDTILDSYRSRRHRHVPDVAWRGRGRAVGVRAAERHGAFEHPVAQVAAQPRVRLCRGLVPLAGAARVIVHLHVRLGIRSHAAARLAARLGGLGGCERRAEEVCEHPGFVLERVDDITVRPLVLPEQHKRVRPAQPVEARLNAACRPSSRARGARRARPARLQTCRPAGQRPGWAAPAWRVCLPRVRRRPEPAAAPAGRARARAPCPSTQGRAREAAALRKLVVAEARLAAGRLSQCRPRAQGPQPAGQRKAPASSRLRGEPAGGEG